MNAQIKLNISSIIGIKDGVDQVFALIDQNLEVYCQHPDNDKFIKDCCNYIHQLDGLLQMLNLTSITIVTEKMEQVIDALIIKQIQPDTTIINALKQSTKSLLFYLNELIDGAEENPLRLYPAYRTLMQAYGFENAPESDLFFPRLTAEPSFKAQAKHIDALSAVTLAKQLGAEFQSGLLQWLRDVSKPEGLQQMTAVVNQIETFPGTTEQREFWWVAAGFLEDLLQQDGNQIDVSVRRLCGKIEQTIRHLSTGTLKNTSVLMRELLYHIANSKATGLRIDDIKRSYAWPGQINNALTFEQLEALNPILERLRNTLVQTNDIWREYCAGQEDSLISLSEYVDWLYMQANQTQCAPLIKLIEAIGNTVTYLHAQPHDMSEELAMEMASALLLIESIIDDFNNLSPDLPEQVDNVASRLLGIAAKDVAMSELPAAPSFDTIASKTQEKELLNQVCQEILLDLAQIERILDQSFFEPGLRSELSRLPGLIKQVSGALVMLMLDPANTLLGHCKNLIDKLSIPDYDIVESEQILLVDGLSSLGYFVEAYRSGRPDSHQIVDEALALFQITTSPQQTETTAPIVASTPVVDTIQESIPALSTTDAPAVDTELLEVYLAEATLVLNDIEANLQRCRINAANRASLIELRRGFHTLKGSGRMVKLDDMSEVAWHMEQALTLCLSNKTEASEALLELIGHVHLAYAEWCEVLRTHGTVEVEAAELIQRAKALLVKKPIAAAVAETKKDIATTDSKLAPQPISHIPPSTVSIETETVNPELLQAFLEETHDIAPQIGGRLRGWRILPQDDDIHRAILRLLHTLKGSARMAGAVHLGELIHTMESHVETAFRDRNISVAALNQLESEFDAISAVIEQLQHSQPGVFEPVQDDFEPIQILTEKTESPQAKTILRINSELIDRLVNDSGEANILRSKIEAQLNNFKQSLQDLTESTHRLHDQLREVEIQAETQMQSHLAQQNESEHAFDPLEFDRFTRFQELTRSMAESIDDIITAQKSLRNSHIVAEEAVVQQSSINRQLQQSLLQIRTLPFSNFGERYYRIARQAAEDMCKKANLRIEGGEVEIDRNVLEKINPPLEHLLRNAIAHGIETPEQRTQAGKTEAGEVSIQLRREGNEIIIVLSDDGRGLDLPRIRAQAQKMGLLQQNEVLDDDKIMSMIFTQGLSTNDAVTGIAGRGIGLDVVKNEISLLGGNIFVQSTPNRGTTFTIHLPLTLSMAQTFMVRTGKQIYAIPAFVVEHQQQFDSAAIQKMYRQHQVELNGKQYPFAHLSHLLNQPHSAQGTTSHNGVLFLRNGDHRVAIHVDELCGEAEVAIKNAGPQLAKAPGVEGATITGDGDVILILNPIKLLQRSDVKKVFKTPVAKLTAAAQKKSTKAPSVMVVDDSLTVRKVTCRLLEREGCDILIAKNGKEAIEILQESVPDIMLIDLEMPKMNGFELIERVRKTPATKHIPIIIISSRTAEKHRKIASDLGVSVFLGKPYKEEELLDHLYRLGLNRST